MLMFSPGQSFVVKILQFFSDLWCISSERRGGWKSLSCQSLPHTTWQQRSYWNTIKTVISYSRGSKYKLRKPNAIQNQIVDVWILSSSGLNTDHSKYVKMAARVGRFIFTKNISIYVKRPRLVIWFRMLRTLSPMPSTIWNQNTFRIRAVTV